MILLKKNQLNQIAVTLRELRNPALPNNWLFVFSLEQSQGDENGKSRIQLINGSTSPRYDLFNVNLPTDLDLKIAGDYMYQCYQMPDNISIDESIGFLVETGKMRLLGDDETISSYNINSNIKIYD